MGSLDSPFHMLNHELEEVDFDGTFSLYSESSSINNKLVPKFLDSDDQPCLPSEEDSEKTYLTLESPSSTISGCQIMDSLPHLSDQCQDMDSLDQNILTCTENVMMSSWTKKHPYNWGVTEVLDFVHCAAQSEGAGIQGEQFRGEAFNNLSGADMVHMKQQDFCDRDPAYGSFLYNIFQALCTNSLFKEPAPQPAFIDLPDSTTAEMYPTSPDTELSQAGSPCHYMGHRPPTHQQPPQNHTQAQAQVQIGDQSYDFDVNDTFQDVGVHGNGAAPRVHHPAEDEGYDSGDSEKENQRLQYPPGMDTSDYRTMPPHTAYMGTLPSDCMYSGGLPGHQPSPYMPSSLPCEPTKSTKQRGPGRPKKRPAFDSSGPGFPQQPSTNHRGRKPGTAAKGNHLWEFIRDLLKSGSHNPKMIKWEDRKEGVFRFVQSEAVAQLWGRKKNNPGMTYEKLSRAMRFCRTAGYFTEVPKNGKFPKKLCFKFGTKAFGWQED